MAVLVVLVAFVLRAAYMGGLGTMSSYFLGLIVTPLQQVSSQVSLLGDRGAGYPVPRRRV